MSNTAIGPGTRVKLNFTLRLDSGDEVDSTRGKAAEFTVGDGNLLPGFEKAMFGMRAGDSASLNIEAKDAFGPHNEENVHIMRRDLFSDLELSEGTVVSFADPTKAELPGIVKSVFGKMVEVDFNHPLAGHNVVFDVEIIEVEQVSQEIFRSG